MMYSRPPPPTQRTSPLERVRGAPITLLLTAINAAVFLFVESRGSTTDTATLLRYGAVAPTYVWAGEYWRLASYMFLHIGWVHFLWNSYASFGVCVAVERDLGHLRFLAVYLLSGIAGGAASTVLAYSVSAGASGAMFGMVGAALAIRRRRLPSFAAAWADPPTRSTLGTIAIWTVIGMTALPMNNRAHIGGLVAGAVATWLFTGRRQGPFWVLYGAAFAGLIVLATKPWLRGTHTRDAGAGKAEADAAKDERVIAACERGVVAACHAFAITQTPGVGDTTRSLEPLCTSIGDHDACAAWGWTLANGRPGVEREPARGQALMRDACAKGSAWGCALAGGSAPVDALQSTGALRRDGE